MSLSGPAAVIILAAGEGTRMKNQTPKVLNQVCGRTMLGHVLAAARELEPGRLIVVMGHGRSQVTAHLAEHAPDAEIVVQDRRGGTGHAVRTVIEAVGLIHGTVVVTYADTPLLRGRTLGRAGRARTRRTARRSPCSPPGWPTRHGYGRIIRDADGAFTEHRRGGGRHPGAAGHQRDQLGRVRVRRRPARRTRSSGCRPTTPRARSTSPTSSPSCAPTATRSPPSRCADPDEVLGVNDRPSWPGRAGC